MLEWAQGTVLDIFTNGYFLPVVNFKGTPDVVDIQAYAAMQRDESSQDFKKTDARTIVNLARPFKNRTSGRAAVA